MATIDWITGKSASFLTAAAWAGGVAPGAADTAVISSAGTAAPTKAGQLLVPASGASKAYLAGLTLSTLTQHENDNSDGSVTTYFETAAPSAVPAGETIPGGTIDLIAGGGEAALYLQNSAVSAKINVNGDAYLYAGYTNTLAGTIKIGLPFSVNGVVQAQPKADTLGYSSALFLDLQPWGSWTGATVPASYTPGVDITGKIKIGGGAAMIVAIGAEDSSLARTGLKTYTSLPPESSQFDNNGKIKIAAGGFFDTYVTNGSGVGAIVNNGAVDVNGAAGETTTAVFGDNVTGHGVINLQGGTQTNVAATTAQFTAQEAGNSFTINDAGLLLAPAQFTANPSGLSYSGGTVTFASASGILEIKAPVETKVGQLYGDPIIGFRAGDIISLHYFLVGTSGTWTPQLVWTQATQTLQLYDVFTNGGAQTKSLQASFTIEGTYAANSFQLTNVSWNGQINTPTSLQITTTTAAPWKKTHPACSPPPWPRWEPAPPPPPLSAIRAR